ncbi:unnamed protein product [marine sediment metagenome]|uniref:Uncharacterized protein n=1 Tax=marine sediment metagenome TaxID=412755 RepID=X1G7P7_9ZZZZ
MTHPLAQIVQMFINIFLSGLPHDRLGIGLVILSQLLEIPSGGLNVRARCRARQERRVKPLDPVPEAELVVQSALGVKPQDIRHGFEGPPPGQALDQMVPRKIEV